MKGDPWISMEACKWLVSDVSLTGGQGLCVV